MAYGDWRCERADPRMAYAWRLAMRKGGPLHARMATGDADVRILAWRMATGDADPPMAYGDWRCGCADPRIAWRLAMRTCMARRLCHSKLILLATFHSFGATNSSKRRIFRATNFQSDEFSVRRIFRATNSERRFFRATIFRRRIFRAKNFQSDGFSERDDFSKNFQSDELN